MTRAPSSRRPRRQASTWPAVMGMVLIGISAACSSSPTPDAGGSGSPTTAVPGSTAPRTPSPSPSDDPALTPDEVVDAVDRTVAMGTARLIHGLFGDDAHLANGTTDTSLTSRRYRSHFEMAAVLLDPDAPDPNAPEELELIVEETVIYMNSPILSRDLGSPTPWIRIDTATASENLEADLSSIATGASDPSQMLNYLYGAVDLLEYEGLESIQLHRTSHYRGTVDLALAVTRAPPSIREALATAAEALIGSIGRAVLPVDLFIDDDDERLIRAVMYWSSDPSTPGQTGGGGLRFLTGFDEFGISVDVSAPPPDQVTDAEDLPRAG